jgi:uncharacterized protein
MDQELAGFFGNLSFASLNFGGLAPEMVALLIFVAMAAGFVDSIAGGGGLLALPALLMTGLNPATVLGINKAQSAIGTLSSTYTYARARLIEFHKIWPYMLVAALFGFAGSLIAIRLSPDVLKAIVPVLLIIIASYFALSPKVSDLDAKARLSPLLFTLAPAAIGFYDGVFGPGAGSFYMMAFVILLGYGVTKATAQTKCVNFASNVGSLSLFIWAGHVIWPLAILMGLGSMTGAQIGSRLAIRKGVAIIRPLLIIMCCLMALRLLFDAENPVRQWIGF